MTNIISDIKEELLPVYDSREASAIARAIAEECFGITLAQAYAGLHRPLNQSEKELLKQVLYRLKRHEPLQYVLSRACFMGHLFRVAPGVLIPRPETEDLVEQVIREYDKADAPCLLDMGTGSGCIVVSLKLALPRAQAFGMDISCEALRQARANAEQLGAKVKFFQADMLKPATLPPLCVDAFVSNPPYVRMSEAKDMDLRVKEYEPREALFVPDDEPLVYYEALARCGKQLLKPGGRIFVEINSAFGAETAALFKSYGYSDVVVCRDRFGKERIVTCRK